jgi:DNA ligase-associated metallophosphoesterase
MNKTPIALNGISLFALGSGALWWPEQKLLCVSDLHLGKSGRIARRGGTMLPPYETRDTLERLSRDLTHCDARQVICLGDSFDDLQAANELDEADRLWLMRLQAGRDWVWIEGNHDPGPVEIGGIHRAELTVASLTFRHIALPGSHAEISGHYHPKAQIRTRARAISRPAFLADTARIVMPAYGTYTGGLRCDRAPLVSLMQRDAVAILTGPQPIAVPMPR